MDLILPTANRLLVAKSKQVLEPEKSRLLISRIPHYVPSEELNTVLAEKFISTEFKLDVKPAETQGGFYSAVVVFESFEGADKAFSNFDTSDGVCIPEDSFGVRRKLMFLKESEMCP
ncbi:unnamed protein product [Microthlaspi erraticum]|uniref:RRM domain-containing protein n=1 Tax=Microthlaspi erraticum TaxID=1685480 RepID=A0A6D2KRX3_9BRAS|nr:unnamed protein product [Microthlaspi erraticum]